MMLKRILPALVLIITTTSLLAQPLNIVSVTPAPYAANVALDANISVTFDQNIMGATLQAGNIVVRGSHRGVIAGAFSGANTPTVTFNPTTNFFPGEVISITITKLILGQSSGLGLVRGHTYSFTAITGASESTPPQFGQRFITYNNALSAMDTKALDFEGDGDMDLLFADAAVFGDVTTLGINDGTGKFCISEVGETRIAEMNDFDGDGDLDMVSSTSGNGTALTRNDGGGVFTQVFLTGINDDPIIESYRSGDIDSDGDVDITLQATGTSPNLRWYKNNGAATFTAHLVSAGNSSAFSYTQIADVNGDGAMDIIAYRRSLSRFAWYENNGSEVFTERIIDAAMTDFLEITMADLDDDGDLDILTSNENNGVRIRWFKNDGNENFTSQDLTTLNENEGKLRVVDVDGDLDRDVIGGGQWLENDGSEVFTPHKLGEPLQQSESIDYLDMDGDGDLDLVVGGSALYNQMIWFENTKLMHITSVSPLNGSHNSAADANITITFDQPLDATTVTTNSVIVKSKYRGVLPGALSVSGNVITFNPANNLLPGEEVSVAVTNTVRSPSRHSIEKNYGFDYMTRVSVVAQLPNYLTTNPAIITYAADPVGLDVADFDNDGDLDLITATAAELHWHRNDGAGNFTPVLIPTTGTLTYPRLTDHNKDGRMDFIIYNSASGGSWSVYMNDASQSFTPSPIGIAGLSTGGFVDVDRDGNDDNLASRFYHLSCGKYSEVARVGGTGNAITWITGDIDNDGDIDLLKAHGTGEFHRSDGAGFFTNMNVGSGSAVARADLDGDGDLDPIYGETSTVMRWYPNNLNTASANFGGFVNIASLGESRSIVTADLDGDGDIDIAGAGNRFGLTVGRNRLGEPTSTFVLNQTLIAPANIPFILKAGDFNGDGKIDLVAASNTDNTIKWFPNIGVSLSPPTITSVSPDAGPEESYVQIDGTNFSTVPTNNIVRFNGTVGTVSSSTTTRIFALVPTGATKGFITVTVGSNTATSPEEFSLLPDINDVDPWQGPIGAEVVLTGTRFLPGSRVYFDGTEAVVASRTTTTIVTHVPVGATTGYIEVHTSEGIASTDDADFVVTSAGGDNIVFDAHPESVEGCPGLEAAFEVSAVSQVDGTDDNLVYEWEYKATAAGTYASISNGTGYSGVDQRILAVYTTGSFGAGFYRCLVTSTATLASEYSEEAELSFGSCTAPVIAKEPLTASIGGKVTIDLVPLITTENLSSLQVIEQPASGAAASIDGEGILTIDYTGMSFTGSESIAIEACDSNGLCTAENFTVEVIGDILVFNAVSPEGKNPILRFQFIEALPDTRDNKVVIYNRWGDVVFEIDNYNNTTNVFAGVSSSGAKLPSGTYYYKVTFSGGRKNMTGFLELRY